MDATLFVLVLLALILVCVEFNIEVDDDINELEARSNWDASVEAWAVQ